MERESFEDEEVAAQLNRDFVAIKVDREERPDIDHIYMQVCQALTGSGGWPLTIFMTPEQIPFYTGTYFPKRDRMGIQGLIPLLGTIVKAWKEQRDAIIQSGNKLLEAVHETGSQNWNEPAHAVPEDAFVTLKSAFDATYGGFGRAPKFPTPHNLLFLLRYWYAKGETFALEMVENTLDAMYRGGIYDHIGFGFCRYSTDRYWLVPHFEKMLYDNALLSIAYLEAYQATGKEQYAKVAKQIFNYVLRDMTSPEGGFYSAEDADSEGVEGKFYIWTPDEVEKVLGKHDSEWFCHVYDITAEGNFEGRCIPNLIRRSDHSEAAESYESILESSRRKLFAHREKRIHPYKDDKILTAWNGLMIAALAMGGRILDNAVYADAAEKSAQFIFSKLIRSDGRLMARYRDGEAAYPAYVDGYAFMIWGLIELYEATFKPEYLQRALQLNSDLLKYFMDQENGGLYMYGSDSEQLVARPKEVYDGATPSGNSAAAYNFLRLAQLTGRYELEEMAERQFRVFSNQVGASPAAHTFMLAALLYSRAGATEIVLAPGSDKAQSGEMISVVNQVYNPFQLVLYYPEDNKEILMKAAPFLADYGAVDGKSAAYVCRGHACQAPITDPAELSKHIRKDL